MIGCRALRDLASSALRPSFFFRFSFTKIHEGVTKIHEEFDFFIYGI
jgi:hypothetical protein